MSGGGLPLRHHGVVIQVDDDRVGEGTAGVDAQTVPRGGDALVVLAVGIRFNETHTLHQFAQISGDLLSLLGHRVVPGGLIIDVVGIARLLHIEAFAPAFLLLADPILDPLVVIGSLYHVFVNDDEILKTTV